MKFKLFYQKLKFSTYVLQSLLFLLELAIDLHEGLLGLIKLVLDGLDLLLELSGLLLGLQHKNTTIEFVKPFLLLLFTN